MVTTVAKRTPTTQTSTSPTITKVSLRFRVINGKKTLTLRSQTSLVLNSITLLLVFNFLVISHGFPTLADKNTFHHKTANLRERRFISLSPIVDRNPSNMLHIGEVPLDGYPHCAEWFSEYRSKCQHQYENRLNRAIMKQKNHHEQVYGAKKFVVSEDADWMKKPKCCGMWIARDCLVGYIERNLSVAMKSDLCPSDLIDRFRRLPTDRKVKADVLDYCSEYSSGSSICRDFAKSGTTEFSHPLLPPFYLCTIMVTLTLFCSSRKI